VAPRPRTQAGADADAAVSSGHARLDFLFSADQVVPTTIPMRAVLAPAPAPATPPTPAAADIVRALIDRARAAQAIANDYDQARIDDLVAAAGWALIEPDRNRTLAELAVADTGIGNVADKIRKNHRKTLGLLRDLAGVRSVGVIAEDPARGLTEIARAAGVVAAITPSTNPAATPANKIINALKGRNAVIVAPSPKGWSTCARLLEFIHREFDRIGAPRDLVQMLPAPITKDTTFALMKQADLVVATGSQANVRAAYTCGTPAFGVGAGNVASIVDETADLAAAAQKIARSKTFDNATSCSSENSVVIVDAVYEPMLAELARVGGVRVRAADKPALQALMWPDGKLSSQAIGQSAATIAQRAGIASDTTPAMLLVEESGVGPAHPFSGEKLSPVLTVYRARDLADAQTIVARIYAFMGAGHSVSLHTAQPQRALALGLSLPVSRVIVNQAHAIATGGSFDNGLPFSLSMGCGTWGGNNFSDNMNWRHYVNITRIAVPIAERVPTEAEIFGAYFARHGRA
jgi:sulfoacetaldehyde dehydrogenase